MKLFLRLSLNDCEGEKAWGKNRGRLIVVTLMLTEQLVCKSAGSCSEASGQATEVPEGAKGRLHFQAGPALVNGALGKWLYSQNTLPDKWWQRGCLKGRDRLSWFYSLPVSERLNLHLKSTHLLGAETTWGDTCPECHTVLMLLLLGTKWLWTKSFFPLIILLS